MSAITETAESGGGADLPEGAVVGEYRVEAKIGEGGFGAVYRAVHPMIGKSAAVKVLSSAFSANAELSARFLNEARAVNRINHGNIVDIFSFGTLPDGRLYFVMELLAGEALDALLDRVAYLPFEDAMPILRAVASAVDAAHGAGIVHRDLKPENVFLAKEGPNGFKVKLLDFGIAKVASEGAASHRTRTGEILGSPYYMSPEQARGQTVDARTDVYSFGAMIHRMLTGTVPFSGNSTIDIVLAHVTTPPPAMSQANPAVPSFLDAPVLAMLAKSADGRPRSLGMALDALCQVAAAAGLNTEKSPQSVVLPAADERRTHHHGVTAAFAATDVSAVVPSPGAPQRKGWSAPIVAAAAVLVVGAGLGLLALFVMRPFASNDKPVAAQPMPSAAALGSAAASVASTAAVVIAPASDPTTGVAAAPPSASEAPPRVRNVPKARPKPTISPDLDPP